MANAGNVEQIIIRVRDDGTPIVAGNMDQLRRNVQGADQSISSLDRTMQGLKRSMQSVLTVFGLDKLREYADHWIEIQNKIRVFTSSLEEARAVHLKLFDVVQESRQKFDPLVQLYSRSAQAAASLGATQNQLVDFTEAVAKSLAIQGVSTTNARGALLQLGQAMGMAKLRAQEFNSINEQAPIILLTVARELYGVNGSVAQLRGEMEKGKVRSKELFDAFLKGLPQIREQFKLVNPTIGQSFVVFQNAIGREIGLLDEHYQISAKVSKGIIAISKNLDLVAKALITLSPLLMYVFGPIIVNAINAVTFAVWRLNLAIRANPLGAIASAVAVAIAYMVAFQDELIITEGAISNLRDEAGKPIVVNLTVGDMLSELGELFADGMTWGAYFDKSLIMMQASWDSFVDNIKYGFDYYIYQAFKIFVADMQYLWGSMILQMKIVFSQLIEGVTSGLNNATSGINYLSSYVNIPEIPEIQLSFSSEQFNKELLDLRVNYGKEIEEIRNMSFFEPSKIKDGANQAEGIFTTMFNNIEKKWNALKQSAIDKKALASLTKDNGVDLDKQPNTTKPYEKATSDSKAKRELEKLKNSLQSLMKTLDPLKFAMLDQAKAEDTLTNAQKKGLITLAEKNKYMAKLPEHFKKLAQPYDYMLEEMQKEYSFLAVNVSEQDTYRTVLKQVMDLKKAGLTVTDEHVQKLAQEAKAYEHLNNVNNKVKALYDESSTAKTMVAYENLTGASVAFEAGIINAEQFGIELSKINLELAQIKTRAGEFETTAFFTGALGGVLEGYTGVLEGMQKSLSNLYASMADGIADSFARAIVYGDNLRDSLVNVSQVIVTELISSLIKLGIQYVVNAAMSQQVAVAQLAMTTAMAKATAAAWAPAASMVSLATAGANALPASAAITNTNMLAMATALSGFQKGGFTGNGAVDEIAGFVHGKEFVMDAETTSRVGVENLQALQDGRPMSYTPKVTGSSGGQPVSITVVNHNNVYGNGDTFLSELMDETVERATQNSLTTVLDDLNSHGAISQTIRQQQ